jgi:hypothetical protein
MIRQVCFLICQGCRDDVSRKVRDFSEFVEEFSVLGKLKALLKSPHEDIRAADVQELLNYTIQEAVKTREQVLGIVEEEKAEVNAKDNDRESSPTDADSQARKRRAAAAAHRRWG